jgi:CubicO group peptidase (beta-lactamase class C family)
MLRMASVLLLSCLRLSAGEIHGVFPGSDWEPVSKPETLGYSNARLEVLRAWMKTQHTTALMVSVGGHVLFEHGDVKLVSAVASVRKSILGMMYGKYIANGTIDLSRTVKDVGLDDVQKFLPIEERATLAHLLMSRSGIYHPDGGGPVEDSCPVRGSQTPGTFFCYTNWGFNAAGTAFERLTGKDLYDALENDLARPIGMQDFDRAKQKKTSVLPDSRHPEYHMYLSTRDMARIGLLMLTGGNWKDTRVLPENWSNSLTTLITPTNELYPLGFRWGNQMGTSRWGYGLMWWVWDTPRLPRGMGSGAMYDAYTAQGAGGQYITVLPSCGLVIAHKVNLATATEKDYVSPEDYMTILNMLLSAQCQDSCK